MEGIQHRKLTVNGIDMHVAEKGTGPVVVLIHGFPELWYSWRHQICALAARGFRAVAPDLRGYGDTSAPPSPSDYTIIHLVGDVVGLIDALNQEKVFVVGHDWGAIVAWNLCLFRPDRVIALVTLSVPYRLPIADRKPVEEFRSLMGDDYYVCKFQAPGVAESSFAKRGTRSVLEKIFASGALDSGLSPTWLSKEDLDYYAEKFEKSGFTGPLNYYRSLDMNWEMLRPWVGAQIKVPTMFITGDLDLVYKFPGVKEYIHEGGFQRDVPFLQEVVIMESVGHFINQVKGPEISGHIGYFFSKFV